MIRRAWPSASLLLFVSLGSFAAVPMVFAQQPAATPTPMPEAKPMQPMTPAAPPHAVLLKDAKTIPGMITLYQKGNNLYAELMPGDYSQEYIVLISISRGIGRGQLLGGMSWGFGDDWIWQFRKVDENVHIVRKNVRFKATPKSPESHAVQNAYTDSVLFSLPASIKGPKGGDLVDLTRVFFSDLPQISQALPGFSFAGDRSTWASVKGFESNLELEVAATYSSGGQLNIDTVPDSRGVTINVHYSISKIPQTSYQPRLADDRIGYFLTVVKDFSSKSDRDQFIRYINRWDLQKADPSLKLSPPVKPIEFWIEKSVPFKYEKAIYDGIYEWNKAFETAGFVNAIIVKRQQEGDTMDPEDIRYNFFRWITSNAGFAMGPSRVNPYTGQILDADIIFDADFLTSWKDEYENLTQATIAELTGGALEPDLHQRQAEMFSMPRSDRHNCTLTRGMSMQMGFGHTAIMAASADPKIREEQLDKFIMQGLKEVTMHEVGHTLGLRHNFKASKWLSIKDMCDPEKAKGGIVASVMDYSPANIVPKDWKQGDYYMQTVGPYDIWAIEYGYKPNADAAELKKIAARSGEPQLAYSTDEDTSMFDPDPDTNRFDWGSDPLEFAQVRMQIYNELLPGFVERVTKEGDDYTQARRVLNILLAQRGQALSFAARYIGGLKTSRSHFGDKDAKPPVTPVDAKTQRDVLALLEENVFTDKPYQLSPDVYNKLGWSNWSHWGRQPSNRKEFPVHEAVLMWQERVISQLLSGRTLTRLHDSELRAPADEDVLTAAELIERLTKSIYSEVDNTKEGEYTPRKPAISSMRRNLQRSYLKSLSHLAMGNGDAPQDCQTVAYDQLSQLNQRMTALLGNQAVASKLDTYSRAHLQESSDRIKKVLEARLSLSSP
ncbi:MAG TPA: zinc-dependent metalloprotease [Pirellulaceae bacterium]|nr:zinc-dependent metalloprotease [Pirellulaceae bacterium]